MQDTELRYLEGSAALKERMKALSGREPNASQIAFTSACLLHGRMFWESAASAPLETRPLLLYYGAAAFAKAMVMAFTAKRPQDLLQSHGLTCAAGDGDLIGNFRMFAGTRGLFQEFNDVVAPLNRITYLEDSTKEVRFTPTAGSAQLAGFDVTILDCLSRTPGLRNAFILSTKNEPNHVVLHPSHVSPGNRESFTLQVSFDGPIGDYDALAAKVAFARAKAPFLTRWQVGYAWTSYGTSAINFYNLEAPPMEVRHMNHLGDAYTLCEQPDTARFEPIAAIGPLTSGWEGAPAFPAYLAPVGGQDVHEMSLMLAALLGLSSLVRYHPHTWTACVDRRPIGQRAPDDTLLPVIEAFLDAAKGRFPAFVVSSLLAR